MLKIWWRNKIKIKTLFIIINRIRKLILRIIKINIGLYLNIKLKSLTILLILILYLKIIYKLI